MHWQTKAMVHRGLSALPFGEQVLYRLQRHITREWPRSERSLDLLLLAAKRVLSNSPRRSRFLEIGAGGDLAVAVGLRLLGVEHITCVDVSRLAKLPLIRHAAAHMGKRLGVSAPDLRTWKDIEAFGIDYVAPRTLQGLATPPHSIECFYSVDTLEHIPKDELVNVLLHACGLLAPAGVSVHLIDYSDHYARGDNSLSRFNFLTFDEEGWARFNSRLHYVNRLRHSQYLRLFSDAGMRVVHAEPELSPIERNIVGGLARPFQGLELADLFTIRALLVASPLASLVSPKLS